MDPAVRRWLNDGLRNTKDMERKLEATQVVMSRMPDLAERYRLLGR